LQNFKGSLSYAASDFAHRFYNFSKNVAGKINRPLILIFLPQLFPIFEIFEEHRLFENLTLQILKLPCLRLDKSPKCHILSSRGEEIQNKWLSAYLANTFTFFITKFSL